VNEKAAWKLLKGLEAFHPSLYPIYLDIGKVGTIHWFAANILQAGVEHLLRSRGEIFLIQKGKKPKSLSQRDIRSVMSCAEGGSDEV